METYSTVAHHRVDLVQGFTPLLDFLDRDAKFAGDLLLLLLRLGNELVERRVEKAEYNRLAIHDLHGALDSGLHVRLEVSEGSLALHVSVAEDHLAKLGKRFLGMGAIEHVLDAEKSDSFCSIAESLCSVLRSVGVGPDAEAAELVDNRHEPLEQRVLGGVHGLDLRTVDKTL